MRSSKRNKFLCLLVTAGMWGCATSSYRVINQEGLKAEIRVSSDRVILECAKLSDENELYMFIIHVLDDKQTVLTANQGNNSDQEDCEKRMRSVRKVLTTGKDIYLGGMGYPDAPREKQEYTYYFPKFGTFHSNGRVLQFMVIANENGACYGAYTGTSKPCPRDEFPIN